MPSNPNVSETAAHNHLVCWKSTVAGVFIAAITYLTLSALGAGILGNAAQSAVENERGGLALASGVGLWLGLSVLLSVFAGGYFTSRISGYSTNKIGAAHGLIVASVFLILMACGVGGALSGGTQGMAKAVQALAVGGSDLAANPQVQDLLQKTIGDAKLRSDAKDVMQGLSARVIQGDFSSAKTYLAYQTGVSENEVSDKINQMQMQFTEIAKKAGEASSKAVAAAGWTVFITLVAGLISAAIGGMAGNHANLVHPLATPRLRGTLNPARA